MKKLIALLLILAMVPLVSVAEYSPGLQMTMQDYIMKYNSIQAPLGAPFLSLDKPSQWTVWNEYHVAWFFADKDKKVTILLMTKDPSDAQMLTSGLDQIQILELTEKDIVPLIGVANRCTKVFSADIFGTSLSTMRVADVICYFYENNCKDKGYSSYNSVDEYNKIILSFFYDTSYTFQICSLEDIQ